MVTAGDYVVSELIVNETNAREVDGRVRIFIVDDKAPCVLAAKLGQLAIRSRPIDRQIWYAGKRNIEITGPATIIATIYAPNATVTVRDTVQFESAILARSIIASGKITFAFDENLRGVELI